MNEVSTVYSDERSYSERPDYSLGSNINDKLPTLRRGDVIGDSPRFYCLSCLLTTSLWDSIQYTRRQLERDGNLMEISDNFVADRPINRPREDHRPTDRTPKVGSPHNKVNDLHAPADI